MTAASDFLARAEALAADLESARAAWEAARSNDPNGLGIERRDLDRAMVRMAEERAYWRNVGAAAPMDHDGWRPSVNGVASLGIRGSHKEKGEPERVEFLHYEDTGAGSLLARPMHRVDGTVLPRVSGGAVTVSGLYITTWKKPHDGTDTVIDYVTTDTIKGALFTNSITPNFSTDTAYTSAPYTSNEVTGTGYSAGGVTLGSKTLTESPTGSLMYDAADSQWTTATFSGARCQLIYDSTVSSLCLCLINFAADFAVTAGTFTVQYAATGLWADDITP